MRLSFWRASVLGILAGLLSVPGSELRTLARGRQQPPPVKVPEPQSPSVKEQNEKDKQPQAEFGISVDVPLVNLEVVATDQNGNPITGLKKANFRVLEDGTAQQVTNFAPTEAAITTVLMLEFSKLVYGLFAYHAVEWGYQFVNQLQKDDYIALVSYDMQTRLEVDFTKNKAEVQNYLAHMYMPGFSEANMFDALMKTLDDLKDVKGRKSILILASGLDTFSKHTLDDCLKRVKQTDVTVFSIGVARAYANAADARGRLSATGRMDFLQAENQLHAISEITGGRSFFPQFEGEIPSIMREVAALLRSQYSVGYSPSNQARDGKYRKVKVEIVGDDGKPLVITNQKGKAVKIVVYARQGYMAPKGGVSD
ncbi:MAG: VWA domain-containing protein [Acidipila sp.]|nr:VWA domain-containing protein [Acidipila sp.]